MAVGEFEQAAVRGFDAVEASVEALGRIDPVGRVLVDEHGTVGDSVEYFSGDAVSHWGIARRVAASGPKPTVDVDDEADALAALDPLGPVEGDAGVTHRDPGPGPGPTSDYRSR